MLPIHIAAGGLAIVLGTAALVASKGGALHRQIGLFFVYSMLTMGISGSLLALRQSLTNANVMGGLMSAYFVITALTAVRPVSRWTRRVDYAALGIATFLILFELTLGIKALGMPRRAINGVPYFMLFVFATLTSAAALGDVRILRNGPSRGGARIARHLWRMCFALNIAAGSFFSIRARVARIFPAPLTTPMWRTLPVLLVFATMFYWLWRVRGRRALAFQR